MLQKMGRAACLFRSRYRASRLQLDHVAVSSVECHAHKTAPTGKKRRARRSVKIGATYSIVLIAIAVEVLIDIYGRADTNCNYHRDFMKNQFSRRTFFRAHFFFFFFLQSE